MKDGWEAKRLGDLCDIELGKTPARANKTFWDERRETGNVWLSIADLLSAEDNVVLDSREYLSNTGAAMSKTVKKGTLLASFKLTLGRLAFAGRDLFTNEAIAALTIRDERELAGEFLFYFLHFFDWDKATEGDIKLKGKTLNKAKLKEIAVLFPALPEQQRVVGILDEAFEDIATAKASAEKNLENARAVFESHLESLFTRQGDGWKEKGFSEVCEISSRLVDPRLPEYRDLLHVGGANIESKTGNLTGLRTAREEGLKSGKFLFDETMVLYSKIRPYLMKVARPGCKGLCSADIYPLSVKPGLLDRDFLFHLLLAPEFTDYAIGGSARAGMPKVNRDHLFAFRVHLPSVNEQRTCADELDGLHADSQRLESVYQRKLAALDELKKSLLHKAFSGGGLGTS